MLPTDRVEDLGDVGVEERIGVGRRAQLLQARNGEGRKFILKGRILRNTRQSQALRRWIVEQQRAAVDRTARISEAQFVDERRGENLQEVADCLVTAALLHSQCPLGDVSASIR